MKTVRFHPEAEAEMIDAAVWYESQQSAPMSIFWPAVDMWN